MIFHPNSLDLGAFCNKNNIYRYLELCVFPSWIPQIFMRLVNTRYYSESWCGSCVAYILVRDTANH